MKTLFKFSSLILAASLAACGTTMPTPQSGFLTNYSELKADASASANDSRTSLRSAVALNPARISVRDVQWQGPPGNELSPQEQAALLAVLRQQLQQRVLQMPQTAGGRPAVIRAAITEVVTVSPALNAVGTLLLIGPLDRGGAAVEIEAVDPDTGKQLAALKLGYFSPITDFTARFSKLEPAEIALRKAAEDFALQLSAKPAN